MGRHLVALVILSACTGQIADPRAGEAPATVDAPACAPALSSPVRVWRLTRTQYDRTVAALFHFAHDEASFSERLPADLDRSFFSNNSDVLTVGGPAALELSRTAERIVDQVFSDKSRHLEHLWPCALAELDTGAPSSECVARFIGDVGKLIYRRALKGEEVDRYLALVGAASFALRGLHLVLETMLQSPYFLYRTEIGAVLDPASPNPLTPHEIVSFLAFTAWDEGPDRELLEIADAGLSDEDVPQLIERVLADERAHDVFARFFLDWFDLTTVDLLTKPDPRSSEAVSQAMKQELIDYVSYIMDEGSGTQEEIFSSALTIHSPALDVVYGDVGTPGDGRVVRQPADQRSGILTLPAWLTTYAAPEHSTPVARGAFIRERILCQEMPPIPPGIEIAVPPAVPGQTTRERFARHSTDPTCAGCHQLMDPIGFLFSSYDLLGSHVTEEQGQPVDSSGRITRSLSFDGEYPDAVPMLRQLAVSRDLSECLPVQMYKFVLGRTLDEEGDRCAVAAITEDYVESGRNVRWLLASLMQRRITGAGGAREEEGTP